MRAVPHAARGEQLAMRAVPRAVLRATCASRRRGYANGPGNLRTCLRRAMPSDPSCLLLVLASASISKPPHASRTRGLSLPFAPPCLLTAACPCARPCAHSPDDGDIQAAWIKKNPWRPLGAGLFSEHSANQGVGSNVFSFPNSLFAHLLDQYSVGVRRDNRFNGGICARAPASHGLTPAGDTFGDDPISLAHGSAADQVGYPAGVDRCWCTGRGNQIRCSQSGSRHCAEGQSCTPMLPRPFGDWSMCTSGAGSTSSNSSTTNRG